MLARAHQSENIDKSVGELSLPSRRLAVGFRLFLIFFSLSFRTVAVESTAVQCAFLDALEQTKFAHASLEAGNAFYESGNLRQAEDEWVKVHSCPETIPAWPKAVYNLGLLEMNHTHYSRAIEYFDEVLRSHPNDKEPGGNIMQVYRNYSHRSVLGISECYEKMGDYRQALRYAWLAKRRYPYLSWCGTCLQSANFALDKRIVRLTGRAYRLHALAILVLGGTFFFWKKANATS